MAKDANDEQRGLRCPKCGCCDLRAYYRTPISEAFRRVRFCRNCNHRVITREQITNANPRSGTVQNT